MMQEKKKLLYASPFWPQKSGISEYSIKLVDALKEYYNITLLLGDPKLKYEGLENFEKILYKKGKSYKKDFDLILYNFGNQPYFHGYMYRALKDNPGMVILHDFSLFYLTVGVALEDGKEMQKIAELAGRAGLEIVRDSYRNKKGNILTHKDLASKLPLNSEVLELAEDVLVHSEYARRKVLEVRPDARVGVISLPEPLGEQKTDKSWLRDKLNIPEDAVVVASLGFIAPSKQNDICCRAVKQYNCTHEKPVFYVMIGDGDFVNSELEHRIKKTGFVDNEDYFAALAGADMIFNLRNPYGGETSATLLQCMAAGKTCFVTDVGWFSELPDDSVIKLPQDIDEKQLCFELDKYLSGRFGRVGEHARDYVANHCLPAQVAKTIWMFLENGESVGESN